MTNTPPNQCQRDAETIREAGPMLVSHSSHWDAQGNHGATCQQCVEGRAMWDRLKAIADRLAASGDEIARLNAECESKAKSICVLLDDLAETRAMHAAMCQEVESLVAEKFRRPTDADVQSVADVVCDVLTHYRCVNTRDDSDGGGLHLVDVLSPGPTIAEGNDECAVIANDVAGAIVEHLRIARSKPREATDAEAYGVLDNLTWPWAQSPPDVPIMKAIINAVRAMDAEGRE